MASRGGLKNVPSYQGIGHIDKKNRKGYRRANTRFSNQHIGIDPKQWQTTSDVNALEGSRTGRCSDAPSMPGCPTPHYG